MELTSCVCFWVCVRDILIYSLLNITYCISSIMAIIIIKYINCVFVSIWGEKNHHPKCYRTPQKTVNEFLCFCFNIIKCVDYANFSEYILDHQNVYWPTRRWDSLWVTDVVYFYALLLFGNISLLKIIILSSFN